jgi:hypothetical protein
MEQDNSGNWKIINPIPNIVGSLQMKLVKFNWATNSVYWQQMQTEVLLQNKAGN